MGGSKWHDVFTVCFKIALVPTRLQHQCMILASAAVVLPTQEIGDWSVGAGTKHHECMYIHIERERERERGKKRCLCVLCLFNLCFIVDLSP